MMVLGQKKESCKVDKLKRSKKKKAALVISLLLFVFSIFLVNYFASKSLQTKGYSSLWDFVKTITSNYINAMDAKPERISIEIKDKDFKFLENNRKNALERNVIINKIDGDYVPAVLEYQGKKLKIKMRLKGHMTDHLQENKWSFRIKVKDKDSFMGMKRFSIQHPGTRGYVYEWIYHEMMRKEGIIALRYKFINVTVNGRDWGIYAVEENFDKELLENNQRIYAPVVRFNPDLYWIDRFNLMKGQASTDEFASYYSANPESYNEEVIMKDSVQRNYFLKAMALIEGLRNKKLSVYQIFDIQKMAKFHAIIDLVGGEHSIDWSDIKYYYNPVSARFEPVAYESFTDLNSRYLTATYKYTVLDSASENYEDWHTAIYSNPEFFREYVKELEILAQPAYLDNFFSANSSELSNNLKILNKEFPYKKFDKEGYYRNQKMISRVLSSPKAVHAYFHDYSNNQIHLQLGEIESLPVEIKSISIGNTAVPLPHPIIIPSKKQGQAVSFKTYNFDVPQNFNWSDSLSKSLKLQYSILGSSHVLEATVFNYPHTNSEFIADDLKNKKSTIQDFYFLTVNENNKTIFIKSGKQVIASDLVIPEGYKVFASGGVSFDLKNKSKIISHSSLFFSGNEDDPITFESTDSSSQGIEIINAPPSKLDYVTFKNMQKVHDEQWSRTGAITFHQSQVDFSNCSFYNSKAEDAVNLIRSDFSFKYCLFHGMHDDALDIDFSKGSITSTVFENCKENALDITMSDVKVKSVYINGSDNKGINCKAGAQLRGEDIKIVNSNIAISAEDLSIVDIKNVTISDAKYGLAAYKNKPGGGHPTIQISKITFTKVKKNVLKEKKSSVVIDGKESSEEVNDVEILIKNEKNK